MIIDEIQNSDPTEVIDISLFSDKMKSLVEASRYASQSFKSLVPAISAPLRTMAKMQDAISIIHRYDYMKVLNQQAETHRRFREHIESIKVGKALYQQAEWYRQIHKQFEAIKFVNSSPMHQAYASLARNRAMIEERMLNTGLLTHRLNLSFRLMEPLRVQLDFIKTTQEAMELSSTLKLKTILESSITMSQVQMERWMDISLPLYAIPSDNVKPRSPRSLSLFYATQADMISQSNLVHNDQKPISEASLSTNISEMARQVLRDVVYCNRNFSLDPNEDIYRPTTNLLEVYNELPLIIANDRTTFGDFIDCVYSLIYEAAGDKKLRYLKEHGGPLDDEDCSIVWHIKAFRNKWLRHDPDHGDAYSRKSDRATLVRTLHELGFDHFPKTKEDFRMLQCRILKDILVFINQISLR